MGDPNLLSKARSRLAETSQKLLRRANQLLGTKDQTPLGDFVKDTRRVGSPKRQLIHNQ